METIIRYAGNTAKILMFIALMVMCMAAFIASINETLAAEPIRNVTVTGDNITLADVFTDVKAKDAGFVLAPAPAPNQTLTWDARTLNRVATAFQLPWRATSASDSIQIRRLANLVDETAITDAIKIALTKDGMSDNVELDFVNEQPQIIIGHDIEPTVTVLSSSYNVSRNTFSATLQTADNQTKTFTGVSYPMIKIPVLKTPARRGDMITNNMIKTIDVRGDFVTDDIALRKDDLVGMTPRRVLAANAPVSMNELNKPTVVERGDLVTMQLENGPIKLTAIAKALESGTRGDIIRVMNMDSKKTLEVQVTGLREARVFN